MQALKHGNESTLIGKIKATLDKEHGLVGVNLPSNPILAYGQGGCWNANGCATKPQRLQENIDSGYAVWTNWATITSGAARLEGDRGIGFVGTTLADNPKFGDLMGENLS